jgi:hypothetical protein
MSGETDTNPILVNTYGTKAPDAAKFGVGATTLTEIQKATDARRDASDASKPRVYSTR